MIKLTNKEYNDLLVKIEEGTKFTVKYLKEYEQQKQRADELERRWNELKDYLLRFENIPVQVQSFKTVFELMKEIERIEKENER